MLYRPFRVDGSANIRLGRRTAFQSNTWLYCVSPSGEPARLVVGDGCVFGYNNHITAVRDVVFGNRVLTANNVYVSDNVHGYADITTPIMDQPVQFKAAVHIGDGCWLGENVCIIGASVGRNSVIGANAVVLSDIPEYSVAVGAPAVVVKQFDPASGQWRKVSAKKAD